MYLTNKYTLNKNKIHLNSVKIKILNILSYLLYFIIEFKQKIPQLLILGDFK
ncbi:hypothetical protein J672_1730 [Acinetobacter sp. 883425]|nr:hypothetical protein J672_1730 [Acinetobacter sp. 883425]